MDALESYVEKVKLSPKQREEILEAGKSRARMAVARVRAKNAAAMTFANRPLIASAISAGGGAVAEEVRRNAIGRLTKDCRSQGLFLILAGGAVSYVGKGVAFLPQVGQAHCALGGAVLAASFHGSKDKPDPLAAAYEMTTHLYKNPSKDKKE